MMLARSPGRVASASTRKLFGSAERRRSPSASTALHARSRESEAWGEGSMTTIEVRSGRDAATDSTFSSRAALETTHTRDSELSRM